MAVQATTNLTNLPFVRSGYTVMRDNETLLQDGARATPLLPFTVMTQVLATRKWVPLTDIADTDGLAIARGIYVGDTVTAAALVAGDVVGVPIIVGGPAMIDTQQLVFENSLTLNSIVADQDERVEDSLAHIGIFAEATIDIDEFEN